MKKIIASIVLLSLASIFVPGTVSSESVFDANIPRPLEPRLSVAALASGFGAAAAVASEAAEATEGPGSGVSARRAAGLSLLLPGLGEQRLGHTLRAKAFFSLEGLAWVSVGSYLWIGYSREKSYKDYAAAFAEVNGTDHPDDFYEKVGRYLSSDGPGGYDEAMRREARDYYYPDLKAMEAYYRAHALAGNESWNWQTLELFQRYASLRSGSRMAYRVALYSAIFAAALRIVSAADAARLTRIDRWSDAKESAFSLGFEQKSRSVALYLQRSF